MIGINLEFMDSTIKFNDINAEGVSNVLNEQKKRIDEITCCYSGNSLAFAFDELQRQQTNLDTIQQVISNYSVILNDVKKSYINQDSNLSSILNSTNSNI